MAFAAGSGNLLAFSQCMAALAGPGVRFGFQNHMVLIKAIRVAGQGMACDALGRDGLGVRNLVAFGS